MYSVEEILCYSLGNDSFKRDGTASAGAEGRISGAERGLQDDDCPERTADCEPPESVRGTGSAG